MKFSIILSILLIALLAYASAQRNRRRRRCAGRPRNPSCEGPRDVGRRGFRCGTRNMFYYDANDRQCHRMRYRGCRGNNNRWCSRKHCQRNCIR